MQSRNDTVLSLETAHIFDESMMQGIDPAIEDSQDKLLNKVLFYPWQSNPLSYSPTIQLRAATGALSIPESFGFSKLINAFKEVGGVHKVWNLLTLECDLHSLFDTLELWFEHTKKVCYSETCQPHQFTMYAGAPLQSMYPSQTSGSIHPQHLCGWRSPH